MSDTNLSLNLLATRLCHDVAGPISAINQGLELLEDADASMREEAMKLIVQSAQQASVRLQFFRLAYGHTANAGESSIASKLQLTESFLQPLRISLVLEGDNLANQAFSHQMLRLISLAVLITSETMLRGGTLTLCDSSDETFQGLRFHMQATQLKLDIALLAALCAKEVVDCDDSKTIHHYMMIALLSLLGGHIEAQQLDTNSWQLILRIPKDVAL